MHNNRRAEGYQGRIGRAQLGLWGLGIGRKHAKSKGIRSMKRVRENDEIHGKPLCFPGHMDIR